MAFTQSCNMARIMDSSIVQSIAAVILSSSIMSWAAPGGAARFNSSSVFVVAAPPDVGFGLRPALRRILPGLLAAIGRQIEEGPCAAQGLDPARGREIGAIDAIAIAIAQEDAERMM